MAKDTARARGLSDELLAAAGALRAVRARLARLIATGLPEGAHPDATTVLVLGLDVAAALERLADVPTPQRTPTPYDPDERR